MNNKKLLLGICSCLTITLLICCVTTIVFSVRNNEKTTENRDNKTTPTTIPSPRVIPSVVERQKENEKYRYTDKTDLDNQDQEKYNLDKLAEADGIAYQQLDEIQKMLDDMKNGIKITTAPSPSETLQSPTPTENDAPTSTPELTTTPQPSSNSTYSELQGYVTPNAAAVAEVAKLESIERIYQEALTWVWVEDATLHGEVEKWMKPTDFLTQTPAMSTNPTPGRIASDCEEHAFTLVSAFRAKGIKPEHIRVVIGEAKFGGEVVGHAWVQYFDENDQKWFELEPSSGDTVDPKTGEYSETDGLPFDFFKKKKYPTEREILYFNDIYFLDSRNGVTNAPDFW